MNTTSPSLPARLRHPDAVDAWTRFVDLYTPLLFDWARRLGLSEHDASDAVQDVLTKLLEKMRQFEYDREKSFRGWLRTVLKNQWRRVLKKRTPIQADGVNFLLAEVPDEEVDLFDDKSYREILCLGSA